MKIRIAGTVNDSIVDGPGLRFTVFTQGCNHKCPGCHNPHTHDLEGGYLITIDEIIEQIKRNPLLDGLTISGGEPFLQSEALGELAKRVRDMNLTVITYTGFVMEQLMQKKECQELIENTHILIDGPFIQEQKSLALLFRGSKNQRVIDVQKSLELKQVVLYSLES